MNHDIVNLESNLNGEGLRIGVVMARLNLPVCEGLRDACLDELLALGVEPTVGLPVPTIFGMDMSGFGGFYFCAVLLILGFFLSLGMAAVFKHIPVYYPQEIGAVGGLVGMIGGLGGFVLPLAFGMMNDLTHIWTSCFMLLFALVATALAWMHLAIRRMERAKTPELGRLPALPEMANLQRPESGRR